MKKVQSLEEVQAMQRDIFNLNFADGPFGGVMQNLSYDKRVRTALKYLQPTDKVLSFGCGDGTVTRRIAEHVEKVSAIDISENAIKTAKKYNDASNVNYQVSTIEDFHTDDVFNGVTLFEVIEHVFDPDSILKKINRLLASSGYLFLSTPNFDRLTRRVKRLPIIKTIRDKKGKDPNRIGCDHVAEYNYDQIKEMLSEAGFEVCFHSGIFLWTNTIGGDILRNVYWVQFCNAVLGSFVPHLSGHMYIVAKKCKDI